MLTTHYLTLDNYTGTINSPGQADFERCFAVLEIELRVQWVFIPEIRLKSQDSMPALPTFKLTFHQ